MTITQFREQLKELRLGARKRKGLEVYDITENGSTLCSITYAELYPVSHVNEILAKKLPVSQSPHPDACHCDECEAIRFAMCGYED